jgi:hypothetical protein
MDMSYDLNEEVIQTLNINNVIPVHKAFIDMFYESDKISDTNEENLEKYAKELVNHLESYLKSDIVCIKISEILIRKSIKGIEKIIILMKGIMKMIINMTYISQLMIFLKKVLFYIII